MIKSTVGQMLQKASISQQVSGVVITMMMAMVVQMEEIEGKIQVAGIRISKITIVEKAE